MFTLLSLESVSQIPGRPALYLACTLHFCGLIAVILFSLFNVSTVRFEVMTVQAGSPEPVRQPQPLYVPIRNLPPPTADYTQARLPVTTETQPQNESHNGTGPTGAGVPSEFLGLLET